MSITERIDAVTDIPESYRRPDPPAPRSVKIELTGRCNYRCQFCALRLRSVQPRSDMSLGLFRRITEEMKAAGVREVGVFYLGESFMAPELLVDSVRWLKSVLGMGYVFLTTNGSLASPEIVERLMSVGLDSLKFSVNAADEQQFEEVTGVGRRYFRASLDNIRLAAQVRDRGGYRTGVYASSIQFDGRQAEKMRDLLSREVLPFVDEHYELPLYSMGSVATQREEELGYRPIAGNQGRVGAMRDPLPCWSAFTEGHVTSSGTLSACCFDADARWRMGDLNEQSFMDAWHSEAFQRLRAAHLAGDVSGTVCQECVAYG